MADTEYTREVRLLNACKGAAEWLEGWASAEPYLSILRSAISEFESAALPSASLGEQREAVIAAHNALEVLLDWDRSRDFIVPYKVRDPIHVAMKQLRSVLAASPASKGAGGLDTAGVRKAPVVRWEICRHCGHDMKDPCHHNANPNAAKNCHWNQERTRVLGTGLVDNRPAGPLGTSPDQQNGCKRCHGDGSLFNHPSMIEPTRECLDCKGTGFASPDQQKGGAGGAIPAAFSTAQVRAMADEAGVTGTVQALMRFAVAAAGLSADQQEQSRGGEG